MRTLTIGAVSLESACGFLNSLRQFQADLVETASGSYEVRILLHGRSEIHEALHAIDDHVTNRADGPVRPDLERVARKVSPVFVCNVCGEKFPTTHAMSEHKSAAHRSI